MNAAVFSRLPTCRNSTITSNFPHATAGYAATDYAGVQMLESAQQQTPRPML